MAFVALLVMGGLFAAPAQALASGSTSSGWVSSPGTASIAQTGGVSFYGTTGSPTLVGYTPNYGWVTHYTYGWVPMLNLGCGIGYEATDDNCNKLPIGYVSGNANNGNAYGTNGGITTNGAAETDMSYLPYWNWAWWDGTGSAPDLSGGNTTNMNNNCDDDAVLAGTQPGGQPGNSEWYRYWPPTNSALVYVQTHSSSKFTQIGGANGSYPDKSDVASGKGNSWYEGCVRYNSYKWTVNGSYQSYDIISYSPVYSTPYSLSYTAPCNTSGATLTSGNYQTTGYYPTSINLSAVVDNNGYWTSGTLTFNDGYYVTINAPFTCQGNVAGVVGNPDTAITSYTTPVYSGTTDNITATGYPSASVYPITSYYWTYLGTTRATAYETTASNTEALVFKSTGNSSSYTNQTVCAAASDSRGAIDSSPDCKNIAVIDAKAPQAQFTVPSLTAYTAATITDTSYEPNSDAPWAITTYSWTVDGNVVSTSKNLNYTFTPGTHTVQETVTDNRGNNAGVNTGTSTTTVNAVYTAPTANFSTTGTPIVGSQATITNLASPGTYPITSNTYSVTGPATLVGNTLTFTGPGSVCITQTVSDGHTSNSYTAPCFTVSLPSAASITETLASTMNKTVATFNATTSNVPTGWAITKYDWDFNAADGVTFTDASNNPDSALTAQQIHYYQVFGTFTANVRVTVSYNGFTLTATAPATVISTSTVRPS